MGAYDGQHHSEAPILYRAVIVSVYPAREAVTYEDAPWRNRNAREERTETTTWGPYASVAVANNIISRIRNGWRGEVVTQTWVEYCTPEWKRSVK